jgi:hypothetical protein
MSYKEQLETLKMDLLWYIFNMQEWEETRDGYTIKYDSFYNSQREITDEGRVYFNGKPILAITPDAVIKWISWYDNYGPEMRAIFGAFEVDLQRFGRIWIGYPSDVRIKTPEFNGYLPKLIKEQRAKEDAELEAREAKRNKEREEFYKKQNTQVFTAATTTTPVGFYGSSTTTASTSYSYIDTFSNWGNTATVASGTYNRPPAANPAITQANRQGRSQREIEDMIRRGRV